MIWSGILIYWANDIYVPLPDALAQALRIDHRLADGMAWHFSAMWLYALNGAIYATYLALSGTWRELVPDRRAWVGAIEVAFHDLGLRKSPPAIRGRFNDAQRVAYTGAIFLGAGTLVTGLAIYKPVQAGWLTTGLGGYEAARFEHFACMLGLVFFIVTHLVQVAREGLSALIKMIPGTRAAAIGSACVVLAWIAVVAIQNGSRDEGAPSLLRGILQANTRVFGALYSSSRLSVSKPVPQAGRAPRVNGKLGLTDGLSKGELASYEIQAEDLLVPLGSIMMLPKQSYSTDFRCIEGWSEVTHYAGTRFSEFLDAFKLGKKPDGSYFRYVGLETPDGEYYVSIDIESMLHPQTLLAYEMNQAPLSELNGAPIRLVIPIKYGIKSLKRIGRITFSDTRPPDYWTERGYDWWAGL